MEVYCNPYIWMAFWIGNLGHNPIQKVKICHWSPKHLENSYTNHQSSLLHFTCFIIQIGPIFHAPKMEKTHIKNHLKIWGYLQVFQDIPAPGSSLSPTSPSLFGRLKLANPSPYKGHPIYIRDIVSHITVWFIREYTMKHSKTLKITSTSVNEQTALHLESDSTYGALWSLLIQSPLHPKIPLGFLFFNHRTAWKHLR